MTTSKKKEIKVVELFAGVGGFRVGFERASKNFNTVWFNQWEPGKKIQHAHDVYEYIWSKSGLMNTNTDLEKVVTEHIEDVPQHDLLVGGFPCQDYSVAKSLSKSKGLIGKKGVLWWSIVSILKQFEDTTGKKKPRMLLLENVDRLLKSPSNQRGRDFAVMLKSLDELGYDVEWRVVDSSKYGFPQRRKRVFIFATLRTDSISEDYKNLSAIERLEKGIFGKSLPALFSKDAVVSFPLSKTLQEISNTFGKGTSTSPFLKAGVSIKGFVYTVDSKEKEQKEYKTLGDILLDEKSVEKTFGTGFRIDKEEEEKWEYQKGAKKIERVNKANGQTYTFSEGSMTYPDALDRASRTIVTGEGGSSASRFKHVIKPKGKRYLRRLTPIELERLNGFDDSHTKTGIEGEISDNQRAFFMGNALVTGVVEKIGKEIAKRYEG